MRTWMIMSTFVPRSKFKMVSTLVSSTWLRKQLIDGLKNTCLVDASWDLETGSEGARDGFNRERIEGSVFFDIDELSDKSSVYDHMLPPARLFQDRIGEMGIQNSHHVIIYDNNEKYGLFSAPRAWWMFRVFGHKSVSVLDGGLPYWKHCQFPLERGPPRINPPQQYHATFNPHLLKTLNQISDCLTSGSAQVVDARSEGRFNGTDPEPRASLPSGHMLGAKNVPFMKLLNQETKLLKSKPELRKVFEEASVDLSDSMVSTCGSGITAAIVALAAHLLNKEVPVYDGSWTEWVQSAPPNTCTKGITATDKLS